MGHFLILLFVVLPLSTLIQLAGNAFFIKVFQGKINKIAIGSGSMILWFKRFEVRKVYFIGGEYSYENLKTNTKLSKILACLGGIIFSVISIILLFYLLVQGLLPQSYITNGLLVFLLLNSVTSILPITINGTDMAGKQVLQLLKKEKLNKLIKDEKNYQELFTQIDTEIARLKKASQRSGNDFMKDKYIGEVFNKAHTLLKIGRTNDAINTLKEINTEILMKSDNTQITYYNNLLYCCITIDCAENVDEIYRKLIELLSMEENKVYETDEVKDTIETYKLYKSKL